MLRQQIRKLKKVWKSFEQWPNYLKFWARFKLILRPMLVIISLILTFVPIYFEQESLIKVYNGITVPDGVCSVGLNFSDPTTVHIKLPYRIKNKGYFDLQEISIKVSLKLDYMDKSTKERTVQTILSASGDQGYAPIGKIFQDIYYKDFMDFNWFNINKYLREVDTTEQTSILIDVELFFYLAGVEKDWIFISNINLTNNPKDSYVNYQLSKSSFKSSIDYNFLSINMVVLLFIMVFFILYLGKTRKRNNLNLNLQRFKRIRIDSSRRRAFLVCLRKAIIYSTIVLIWNIILLIEVNGSNVYTSHYESSYRVAIIISTCLIFLMNIISFLPFVKPLRFKKYSISEGWRSLFSSSLSVAILILWSTTTVISYEVSNNIFIIRDTFPSFIPIIIIASINFGVKFVDLFLLKIFDIDFKKLSIQEEKDIKSKHYIASNKKRFTKILLTMVREINDAEDNATISKIKSKFRQEKISPVTNFGSRVNRAFLNSLVGKNFLRIEKEGEVLSYFLTIKGEDLIQNSKSDDFLVNKDNDNPYESWKDELIKCSNPKCNYFCNPRWRKCPVCSTELTINKYCVICGKNDISKEDDKFTCDNCYIKEKNEINYCHMCGIELVSNECFCINCYYPLFKSTERYKHLNIDKLYKVSLLFERVPRFLIILMLQVFFILFIIVDLSNFYGFTFNYNFYYLLIIAGTFMILIFYFQLNFKRLRKERILRDKLYRIKLSVIHYKYELVENTTNEKIREFQYNFRSANGRIKNLMRKVRLSSKIICVFKYFSLLMFMSSIVLLFWNYLISMILIVINLSMVYFFVGKAKIRYINDIFRLALSYDESLYEDFVIYVITQLNYL